jgi:superfamily II DNA or RNA helicase
MTNNIITNRYSDKNTQKLLSIFTSDYGGSIENFITKVVDGKDPGIIICTSHKNYKLVFSDSLMCTSRVELNYLLINISKRLLENDVDMVKYFLRRQFIADEELYSLYLRRGKEVRPHEAQEKAIANLVTTRKEGKNKAVAILATGLGKTILSALDVKESGSDRVLFVVHVNEILKQTRETFERVLPNRKNEMGFYNGIEKSKGKKILFASIQTLGKKKHIENFASDYFDYIIIDETHHTAAPTYGLLFSYFKPKFFLGLTATPDRMDRKDILGFYNNNVVFEMNQEQAIEQGYLAPFKYLGFKDSVDYSNIYFNGFKYDTKDLNKHLLIDERDQAIIKKFKEIAGNRKTIGFCASIEHAERCATKFKAAGIDAIAVHSRSRSLGESESKDKSDLIKHFRAGKCQIAFVVDMFNEGVDIPDVTCLLFLRPTESKTIFIQHMGRGLRVAPKKENVLILDFIGNYKTANLILDGLNVKDGIRGLKKINRNGKDLFVYDLNGCEVIFESEVIEIFKNNEVSNTKDIRKDVIGDEWHEYAKYLEKWTKDNLYWKRGQQNQYFEVNFEALNILKQNPGIQEKEFVTKIQKIVEQKYPGKNMTAGFRALILSKITGFVSADTDLKPTKPFEKVCLNVSDFSDVKSYEDILTSQLEKIMYWNPIYGSYNKYIGSNERVSFKDFKVYPFFFIYDVLLRLMDEYGSEPYVTKFEFNNFMSITKEHSEANDVTERILRFRNDSERQQTQKLLESKSSIDPRFYGIIHYNKYIEKDKKGIKIRAEYLDEIRNRVYKFRDLYNSGKLIVYKEEEPEKYKNMLHSVVEILSYHDL